MKPKRTLYLVVTEKCNFSCDYCLYKKRDTVITPKIFKRGIDFFLWINRAPTTQKEIYLFGGEPLLYPDLVKGILVYIVKNYSNLINKGELKIKMLTNGALLNREMYDLMNKFTSIFEKPFFELTLSFDGSAETQNFHRSCGNQIAYKIKKIIFLRKINPRSNLDLGIAWTITPYSLDCLYRDFLFLFEKLKIHLAFSYLGMRLADLSHCLKLRTWKDKDIEIIKKEITKIMKYYHQKNLGKKISIHPLNLVREMRGESITKICDEYNCINLFTKRCALGDNITLFPDGRISACCIGRFLDSLFHENNPLMLCDITKRDYEEKFCTNYKKLHSSSINLLTSKQNLSQSIDLGRDFLKKSNKVCFLMFKKKEILNKNKVERAYLRGFMKSIK